MSTIKAEPIETKTTSSGASTVTLRRLQLCFATLCCLGGIVISGNEETQTLPYIAVFFAVFGYIFVDRLQLFALPPLMAYIAMACVAVHCVGGFWDMESPGNRQMVSVANLLVMVQSILMLQQKTPRIFEQLTVFCLLQLVVAAVFNNAISYGVLLIPICLLAATGLALLSSLSVDATIENFGVKPFFRPIDSPLENDVTTTGQSSFEETARMASRLPRTVIVTVVPAVALIGAVFFYALPRTTDAARPRGGGQALVGFSDKLHLDQIGQMQQNGQIAMRLSLRKRPAEKPYLVRDGIYLRGRVLDLYGKSPSGQATYWKSSPSGTISSKMQLPREFVPQQKSDLNFYDAVEVEVACESIRTPTLFAVAPYYDHNTDKSIVHRVGHWTISHNARGNRAFPRTKYRFLTHGFRAGVQTEVLAETASGESVMVAQDTAPDGPTPDGPAPDDPFAAKENLLRINRATMPTAVKLADRIAQRIPEQSRNSLRIARRITSFLAQSNQFTYTLRLDKATKVGMDPIEQFLSVDRSGHCQYFASAMVMMLRSQGIPSRIVVGYRTDEYNDLGQYYLVRQLHAHAWVEALIAADELDGGVAVYGQPRTKNYWMRFDPTPNFSLPNQNDSGVSQVFDLAQNIWDDYVVDMDGNRQAGSLTGRAGDTSLVASYASAFRWIEFKLSSIRAGQLGGGSLAGQPGFSWSAALATLTAGILIFFVMRVPIKRRRRRLSEAKSRSTFPRFTFYQETLRQLARLHIEREKNQTPAELAAIASSSHSHPERASLGYPLEVLTAIYYRMRYGKHDSNPGLGMTVQELDETNRSQVDTALGQLKERIDQMTESNPVDRLS